MDTAAHGCQCCAISGLGCGSPLVLLAQLRECCSVHIPCSKSSGHGWRAAHLLPEAHSGVAGCAHGAWCSVAEGLAVLCAMCHRLAGRAIDGGSLGFAPLSVFPLNCIHPMSVSPHHCCSCCVTAAHPDQARWARWARWATCFFMFPIVRIRACCYSKGYHKGGQERTRAPGPHTGPKCAGYWQVVGGVVAQQPCLLMENALGQMPPLYRSLAVAAVALHKRRK